MADYTIPNMDNSIAAGVKPPPPSDPVGMLSGLAEMQNRLNTARLFQQQWTARQQAGDIMATSPDTDVALERMSKNPQVAGFLPDMLSTIAGYNQTMTNIGNVRQGMATSGLQATLQALPSGLTDLSSFDKTLRSRLSVLPQETQRAIAPAVGGIEKALFDDLPSDPKEANLAYRRRLNAMMLGAGFTPGQIAGLAGSVSLQDIGPGYRPVVTQPSILGGDTTVAPGIVPKGLPPAYVSAPGGVTIPSMGAWPRGYVPLGGQTPGAGSGGNELGVQSPAAEKTGGGGTGASAPPELAGDGTPLIPASGLGSTVSEGKGLGGLQVLSPAQQAQAQDMMKDFSDKGATAFNNAQQVLGSLRYIDSALDNLAREGGFLTPGAGAKGRVGLAKAVNTFAQVFGEKPPFDPSKVMSAEDAMKESRRLGFTVVNQMFGAQREAASVIENAAASVPGIDNSYLGGKLLTDSIRAAAQRQIDQRNFQLAWANKNQGNLMGSMEAFNNAHPASAYADRVLKKFGMNEKGFESPEAVRAAYKNGYISRSQATQILQNNWGDRFGGGKK